MDPKPPPDEPELEPMGRDSRFIVRLVLALIVSVIAAAFVGSKLQSAASGCGAGLVNPGSSVIPPADAAR